MINTLGLSQQDLWTQALTGSDCGHPGAAGKGPEQDRLGECQEHVLHHWARSSGGAVSSPG